MPRGLNVLRDRESSYQKRSKRERERERRKADDEAEEKKKPFRRPLKVNKFEPVEIKNGTIFKDEFKEGAWEWKIIERMRPRTDKSEFVVWNTETEEWFAARMYKNINENHRIDVEEYVFNHFARFITSPRFESTGLTEDYRFLVMSLWGPTIQELVDEWKTHGGLHEEDILKLALGSLMSLKELHKAGYAHCNLRPSNFAVPFLSGQSPIVMQIDFDFCRFELSPSDTMRNEEIKRRKTKTHFVQIPDNLDYSSKKFLDKWKHGRAEDIESWLYMVINMYVPLPWLGETDMKVLMKKREELKEFMEKEPRVKFLIPILDLIPSTREFEDFLPNLLKIGEILLGRLKEIKGKVTGKWHFEDDCIRNHMMAVDEKPEKRSEEDTIQFIRDCLSNKYIDKFVDYER